jgi:hypothetical protein
MVPHAVVEDSTQDAFPETKVAFHVSETLVLFKKVPQSGTLLVESDAVVNDMRERIVEAWGRMGDRFPDHLARNLLIAAGAGAAMRRKGDNAARMDIALGPPWPLFGFAVTCPGIFGPIVT